MAIPPEPGDTGTGNTSNLTVIRATPTSGQTINGAGDGINELLSLEHTNTIASLTINFPTPPTAGQIFDIASTGAVTVLNLVAAGMAIMNTQAQLAIGDYLSFRYVKANTWMRRI